MRIVSENRFSGKTYFYTIASRVARRKELEEQDDRDDDSFSDAESVASEGDEAEAKGEEGVRIGEHGEGEGMLLQ